MTQLASRPTPAARSGADPLLRQYQQVRLFSERFCEPLATEDYVIQTMPDVSPIKWHLAHTTWFFERFVLQEHQPGYEPIDPRYYYLFNSYYNGMGPQHCRPSRGLLSRPTVEQVHAYRRAIDRRLAAFVSSADAATRRRVEPLIVVGIHHEQQHQELMATDLKHVLSSNPLLPAYVPGVAAPTPAGTAAPMTWVAFDGGVTSIGHDAASGGFAYDNESPRHRVFLEPYELGSRLVTNGEYLRFIEDGGYTTPGHWLSMGWATVRQEKWTHPIYWYRDADGDWREFTLAGPRKLEPDAPLSHVSYYEADAFARWSGARLPTEFEWEAAAVDLPIEGTFADELRFEPAAASSGGGPAGALRQMFGELWQWTSSSYGPYPGYAPPPGALGEYNGKFMCNQYVLRGGSCATHSTHLRRTYRNFFPPEARWQFSGVRLARSR